MLDTPDATRIETLASELKEFRSEILDDWIAARLAASDPSKSGIPAEITRSQTDDLLSYIVAIVEDGDIENEATPAFQAAHDSLAQVAFAQATAGVSIREIGASIGSLKDALRRHQERHGGHSVAPLFAVVDRLFLGMVEGYVARREGFIESIIESAADGIITISEDATIHLFNGAAEKMFGYDAAEAIGNNVNMLMTSPDRDRHDANLERYLRTGEARILGFRRELEGQRKDGTVFPLELGVREVMQPGATGGKRIFSGIVRDLTEIKAAQAEILRKSQDILELSTPVLSVWKDVLVLPLVGTLDSRRTTDTMEKALTRMAEEKARILIIDITGVPVVDTMVADHLVRLAAAVQMMGGECVITGISPATAMIIVSLGVDLSMLRTGASLAQGLKLAIDLANRGQGSAR